MMRNICDRIAVFLLGLFMVALGLSVVVATALLSLPFMGEGWDYAAIELWDWQLPFIPVIRGFFWLVIFSYVSFLLVIVMAFISERKA